MNTQLELRDMPAPVARAFNPSEYKVVSVRECALERDNALCDTAQGAARYWQDNITKSPRFDSFCECFAVLMLNTRRRIKGHAVISNGTLDTLLVHPREVFRPAVIIGAAALVLMHNHPSGDPTPSESDIKVTRDLMRAGQLMKIEVLDHVIVGHATAQSPKWWASLRELGYFCV